MFLNVYKQPWAARKNQQESYLLFSLSISPAICIGNNEAGKYLERASSLHIHFCPIFKDPYI